MKKISWLKGICIAALSVTLSSCIWEDVPECANRVRFVYDHNLLWADAFPSSVDDISLYIFDRDSVFVGSIKDQGTHLDENYRMELTLDTGIYLLVAWGGHDGDVYEVPELRPGESVLSNLTVKLRRGADCCIRRDEALGGLFYGTATMSVRANESSETTVHLMNNTKSVNVVIQSTDADTLSSDYFTLKIIEDNGWLSGECLPLKDDTLSYYAHYKTDGSVTSQTKAAGERVQVVKAELSTLRLMEGKSPRLVVTNDAEGETVLDIDLLEYMRLLKPQQYADMGYQEFFDRTQECNIVFFVSDGVPVAVEVRIGPWKIIREMDMEI